MWQHLSCYPDGTHPPSLVFSIFSRPSSLRKSVRGRIIDHYDKLSKVFGKSKSSPLSSPRLAVHSAPSRDRIRGLGAEEVVTPRQQGFLHEPARFDTARLVIVAFRRRSGAMTEHAGGDPDMRWVVDRDAGGCAIPK